MNKTKIVCSIGPSSCDLNQVKSMIDAGMDVARFNMSHGTHESHRKMIDTVKLARQEKNVPLAIMIDTKGPEIRIKNFKNGKITLVEGQEFVLTTKEIDGDEKRVSVTYQNLPKFITAGTKILLNDGYIELTAKKVTKTDVVCTVSHGGELSNHKSINIPGVKTDLPYLSEIDKKDILFAKEVDSEYLAISFVNTPNDVKDIKKFLKTINFAPKIISKIESMDGVKNFNKILKESDGIMVARGDLGVEIDFVKIPILQKEFIARANDEGKISITATQMLESMIKNPRPTRAEISDVANAVFDGTSAIMLSGETASGLFPTQAVQTMSDISYEAEHYIDGLDEPAKTHDTSKSLGYGAYSLTKTDDIKAIIVLTESGKTAEDICRYRPTVPIIACTPQEKTFHKMSMFYGVQPILDESFTEIEDLKKSALQKAIKSKIVKKKDKILIVSGVVAGKGVSNNMTIEIL